MAPRRRAVTAPVRVRGLGLRIQRARFLVPRQAERFRSPLIEAPPHGARAAGVARARVSWLISPKARGTSHLNCHGESERTQGGPKPFRTSERPRDLRERNWPKP